MNEHILTKEHMESANALAQTNLKISEAKNALFKLQEDETLYLTEREKKALARIQQVFVDSDALITQTKNNYSEVNDLLRYASTLAGFIIEAQGNFHQMLLDFHERDALWHEDVAKTEEKIMLLQRKINADNVEIANERKNIAQAKKTIDEQNRKIADSWEEIKREIKRLKAKQK